MAVGDGRGRRDHFLLARYTIVRRRSTHTPLKLSHGQLHAARRTHAPQPRNLREHGRRAVAADFARPYAHGDGRTPSAPTAAAALARARRDRAPPRARW